MTDDEFFSIAKKLIGRSYNKKSYDCRHLACDFLIEIGIDAHSVFGVNSDSSSYRHNYKSLVKRFKKVGRAETCLMIAYSKSGNHVAIKHKSHVLHNYGFGNSGQVLLTDITTFLDSFHRVDYYEIPLK